MPRRVPRRLSSPKSGMRASNAPPAFSASRASPMTAALNTNASNGSETARGCCGEKKKARKKGGPRQMTGHTDDANGTTHTCMVQIRIPYPQPDTPLASQQQCHPHTPTHSPTHTLPQAALTRERKPRVAANALQHRCHNRRPLGPAAARGSGKEIVEPPPIARKPGRHHRRKPVAGYCCGGLFVAGYGCGGLWVVGCSWWRCHCCREEVDELK